jgi:hypothetical protein
VGYGIADSLDGKTRATAKLLICLALVGSWMSSFQQGKRHYAQFVLLGITLLHAARIDGIIRKIEIWV